jgi:hypothetical protein
VLNPQGCAFRAAVTQMLDEVAAPLNLAVEVQGVNRQLSLVTRGVGLGCVPVQVARRSPLRSRFRLGQSVRTPRARCRHSRSRHPAAGRGPAG